MWWIIFILLHLNGFIFWLRISVILFESIKFIESFRFIFDLFFINFFWFYNFLFLSIFFNHWFIETFYLVRNIFINHTPLLILFIFWNFLNGFRSYCSFLFIFNFQTFKHWLFSFRSCLNDFIVLDFLFLFLLIFIILWRFLLPRAFEVWFGNWIRLIWLSILFFSLLCLFYSKKTFYLIHIILIFIFKR